MGQAVQVFQRLQILDSTVFGTAGSRVVRNSEWDRSLLEEIDDIDWPGGGHSCVREVRQMGRHQERMGQLEFRG